MSVIENFIQLITEKNLWEKPLLLKKNEFLVNEGDISEDLFFVKLGALIVGVEIEEKQQIIRLCYKNSLFSSIDSFLTKEPTIYSIKAIKESEVLKVNRNKIQLIFDEYPEIFQELLVELIRQQSDRELDLLHSSAAARFDRLLKRSPQVFQEIPHKYIASYLRISAETLSRLLKS